ncbi:putative baseplate assembly protein [Streptomyces sp. ISL-10]|uniref:putative baseplate assembly protein n=1 Tax=Streptomyces sp. ISL-10 TaxID=2819172 RepID=UPI002034A8E7|nr:putative baseplate assembly protein [Streptomyces sp. ISL-10]
MSDTACRCGCGTAARTAAPAPVRNRPALPALNYRVGTYDRFLHAMLARLYGSDAGALADLTTREPDDPTIALLDGWAVVADVLTFYQERIANEGYLRTATEQESLIRLGRLVGHRPRPALAAATHLAYTLDADARATVPAGSQVKSAPPPGGLPQTFETATDLAARAEWNRLPVRKTTPPAITADVAAHVRSLPVDGLQPGLRPGDRLLFTFGDPRLNLVRVVDGIELDAKEGRTTVLLKVPDPRHQLDEAVRALQEDMEETARERPSGGPFEDLLRLVRDVRRKADVLHDPDALAASLDSRIRKVRERIAGGEDDTPDTGALLDRADVRLAAIRAAARQIDARASDAAPVSRPPGDSGREALLADRQSPGRWILRALNPLLRALGRRASRPRGDDRGSPAPVGDILGPGSDALPRLVAGNRPDLTDSLYRALGTVSLAAADPPGVQCFRVKATPFGATIPDDARVTSLLRAAGSPMAGESGGLADDVLMLDAVYDAILPGSWIAVHQADGGRARIIRVTDVTQLAVADEHHAVRVTRLRLAGPWAEDPGDLAVVRATTVWAAGERLPLAARPDLSDVAGDRIQLDGTYEGLTPGRLLFVSGERTDILPGDGTGAGGTAQIPGTELVRLAGAHHGLDGTPFDDRVRTTLQLTAPLARRYRRDSVAIHGNVVPATAGETRTEVLGSGDATQAGQVFPLRHGPLTWLPAANSDGGKEALTVRVAGVTWRRTTDLAVADPAAHAYRLRVGADGMAAVEFGDGRSGSRLPTGMENVTARYRIGGGAAGNVAAGQLSQVVTKPLGVSGVTNPLPATGGADADGPDDTRCGVPLRLAALDRLVSVHDYQDFARAFAGVGKAEARRCIDGSRQLVHVTVAAADDAPLEPGSLLLTSLRAALSRYGDPALPVRVEACERVRIVLSLGVRTAPDHSPDKVERLVREALLARLGFLAADLGRPVFLSAAIAVAQAVPGVEFLDVDAFGGVPEGSDAADIVRFATHPTVEPCVMALPAGYREVRQASGGGTTTTPVDAAFDPMRRSQGPRGGARGGPRGTTDAAATRRVLRPAQLALVDPALPETLVLRRIP